MPSDLWDRHSYQARLEKWWRLWHAPRSKRLEAAQADDHDQLLRKLRGALRSPSLLGEHEGLKLEIWVRWNPRVDRELRLWASSTGTWPDVDIARKPAIEADSIYAAIQVYCSSAAEIVDTSDRSERWARYLGVPIRIDAEGPRSVVVGVITLATDGKAGSRLIETNNALLRGVAAEIEDVGQLILGS